ncbi:hypothetical protein [Dyadobacter psychrotolerans]|uniref:Uncharacterized protein n=1 Tax=Dyadobacter psychrotolerans TaxID=2541721 RepID=A0A4R5DZR9_9BACT|nr:hypothetical protein [Dyadobacter psychrotolerans]TDE16753.1 hypothetical protein E0F88_11050 [Dyadobacter psychrotolerans]
MELTVNIPDKDLTFFRELLKKFQYQEVQVNQSLNSEDEEFIQDLKEGMKDVELHLAGKKQLKTANELWNEL